jgi:hypothetical protein
MVLSILCCVVLCCVHLYLGGPWQACQGAQGLQAASWGRCAVGSLPSHTPNPVPPPFQGAAAGTEERCQAGRRAKGAGEPCGRADQAAGAGAEGGGRAGRRPGGQRCVPPLRLLFQPAPASGCCCMQLRVTERGKGCSSCPAAAFCSPRPPPLPPQPAPFTCLCLLPPPGLVFTNVAEFARTIQIKEEPAAAAADAPGGGQQPDESQGPAAVKQEEGGAEEEDNYGLGEAPMETEQEAEGKGEPGALHTAGQTGSARCPSLGRPSPRSTLPLSPRFLVPQGSLRRQAPPCLLPAAPDLPLVRHLCSAPLQAQTACGPGGCPLELRRRRRR